MSLALARATLRATLSPSTGKSRPHFFFYRAECLDPKLTRLHMSNEQVF